MTGYSIKYAWHSASPADGQRIVLVTDRRLGTSQPQADAPPDAELTVIEMRLDRAGKGEARSSFGTGVVMDSAANTLALEGYSTAPVLLEVTR